MIRVKPLSIAPVLIQIAAGLVMSGIAKHLSNEEAIRQAALQEQAIKDMIDSQYHEMANLLARRTSTPEWEWFNTLTFMRDNGLLDSYEEPAQEKEKLDPKLLFIFGGLGILGAFFILRR